jgi:hypothetical protein
LVVGTAGEFTAPIQVKEYFHGQQFAGAVCSSVLVGVPPVNTIVPFSWPFIAIAIRLQFSRIDGADHHSSGLLVELGQLFYLCKNAENIK